MKRKWVYIGKWIYRRVGGYDPENPVEALAQPFNDPPRPKKPRPAPPTENPSASPKNQFRGAQG